MSLIDTKMILPAQRCVATNDLVILREADGQGVLSAITELVELFGAEAMVAGSVD